MSADKNRIVTPTTDPDRWTPEEARLFNQGKCSETIESGNGRGIVHCGKPSKPGASFGHCADHEARLAEYCWPDGSNRR
jgi:ribonucleotide monophosphatase NagD (HAD superfamily)